MERHTTDGCFCGVEHQPRERPVRCCWCMRTFTWALDAVCDACVESRERTRLMLETFR